MPEYWFVVDAESEQLYDALRRLLGDRPCYHVIRDRRRGIGDSKGVMERRTARVWRGDEMSIAEVGD